MLCLAALHGMVASVGSDGGVMQVKKEKKEKRNLNVHIATTRTEHLISQHAEDKRTYAHGNGNTGLCSELMCRKLFFAENSLYRDFFLILFGL